MPFLFSKSARANNTSEALRTSVVKMPDKKYKSDKFMVCYGDVRSNKDELAEWEAFMDALRKTEAWKATRYNEWDPEGGDWGWMSSKTKNGDIDQALKIFKKLGFFVMGHQWDPSRARLEPLGIGAAPSREEIDQALRALSDEKAKLKGEKDK
jgi:hypothetical protein